MTPRADKNQKMSKFSKSLKKLQNSINLRVFSEWLFLSSKKRGGCTEGGWGGRGGSRVGLGVSARGVGAKVRGVDSGGVFNL